MANYQPLGSISSTDDPCQLKQNYNKCINEAVYIQFLNQQLTASGIVNKTYITDTSRNGNVPCYASLHPDNGPCSCSCNVKGCTLGELPSTDTDSTEIGDLIDAFVWIKVPGDSDGTSNSSASDYNYYCGGDCSMQDAPQYEYWFDQYFVMLTRNVTPGPVLPGLS